MRQPRNYQALKDQAQQSAPDDAAPDAERATTTENSPAARISPAFDDVSGDDKIEKAFANFNEGLAERVKSGGITPAERSNLRGRWENDVLRGDPVDQVTARYDGSRSQSSPQHARGDGPERPETGAKRADGDRSASEQAVTGGKEMTEGMQARLDRLHAAQSNAPKGWDGPTRPNENGQGGRGGGGRGP